MKKLACFLAGFLACCPEDRGKILYRRLRRRQRGEGGDEISRKEPAWKGVLDLSLGAEAISLSRSLRSL